MERNLMIAGFGGQGVMMMGKLLAYSTFSATDRNVTFFPSYGAEQRGGTANCYVVISDEEIGAPLGDVMDDLVVMNETSLDKFLYKVKEGGLLFMNSSIVRKPVDRNGLTVVKAPVTELSMELGNPKVLNVIMLGVYVGYTRVLPEEVVRETLKKQLLKKPALVPLNEKAFALGLEIGKRELKASGPDAENVRREVSV